MNEYKPNILVVRSTKVQPEQFEAAKGFQDMIQLMWIMQIRLVSQPIDAVAVAELALGNRRISY